MPTTTAPTAATRQIHLSRGGEIPNDNLKEQSQGRRMVRLTVNLPSHLVEQMRDAVYWTPGLTLAWMIARAVRASLTELETVHQGPFPRRLKPLRAGRPRLLGQVMNVGPMGAEKIGGAEKSVLNIETPLNGRSAQAISSGFGRSGERPLEDAANAKIGK